MVPMFFFSMSQPATLFLCELLSCFKGNHRTSNTMVFFLSAVVSSHCVEVCVAEKGRLSRNRMFLSQISCLSTLRFMFLCSKTLRWFLVTSPLLSGAFSGKDKQLHVA